jgi:hypothetical protein
MAIYTYRSNYYKQLKDKKRPLVRGEGQLIIWCK